MGGLVGVSSRYMVHRRPHRHPELVSGS
jgi:hypothetical protein